MGFGTNIMKSLMFVFNGIVWVLGLVLFVVGIVVLVEGENWNEIIDSKTVPVSVLLIVVGFAIAVVGFLGCFGAMKQNSAMLLIYTVVLGIVIIVQLVAGVLAFIFSDEASTYISEGMSTGLNQYGKSKRYTEAMDWIQEFYTCCGVDDFRDWTDGSKAVYWVTKIGHTNDLPDSCCVTESEGCGDGYGNQNVTSVINPEGCYATTVVYLRNRGLLVGIVSMAVIFVEMLCIFIAFRIHVGTEDDALHAEGKRRHKRKPGAPVPHGY